MLDNGFGTNEYPRDQANTALTWFASENHETKFGIDWREVKWLQDVRRQTFDGPRFSATTATRRRGGSPCGISWAILLVPGVGFCFMEDYSPADVVARGKGSSEARTRTPRSTLATVHHRRSLDVQRRPAVLLAGEP